MANVKISGLPTASTPLTGAELVPVVQSGVTSQTTVSDFGAAVSYTPAGTGAVATTVQTKLNEMVSVFDFMTPAQIADVKSGSMTIDVKSAIQNAFNASKSVYFPSGTYWCGTASTQTTFIDLTGLGVGISIITDESVELVCQTTANVYPAFFTLSGSGTGNSHFYCGPIRFRDLGYDPTIDWKGAVGFKITNTPTGNFGNLIFESIYSKNMVSSVMISGGSATNRVRGIHIGQIFSDDCYYGFNAQDQGDGVVIDNLIAYRNIRPYFIYGVTDHKVKIFSRYNRGSTGSVNIARQVSGLPTSGIDVHYVARDQDTGPIHVSINHIDLLGGTIKDIKIHLDIESTVNYWPLQFINYTGSGGSPTTAPSLNNVTDIIISGTCDTYAYDILSYASYANKGNLNLTNGKNINFDTSISSLFYFNRCGRNITPTWLASTTNPTIGNGTLSGSWDLVDGVVTYTVFLQIGSTTTTGSGYWTFSLPFASPNYAVGSAQILDSGTCYYTGVAQIPQNGTIVSIITNGATTGINSNVPMTWAAGDQLIFTITYPIS